MIDIAAEGRGFIRTVRDGCLIWKLAPFIPLIAILPEFIQHCAEISLGMFGSREAFRALAMDTTRMVFGGFKIAGVLVSMLMAARFWTNRAAGARWWSLSGIGWKQVLIGFAVQIVFSVPALPDYRLGPVAQMAVSSLLTIASLPGMVLMIGGIVGDRQATLGGAFQSGWGKALRIAIYFAPLWVVLQMLHRWDHTAALGRSTAVVWALMTWDSLVVGLMATMAGTALHHGYTKTDRL